jgi:dienelactone hydrolase
MWIMGHTLAAWLTGWRELSTMGLAKVVGRRSLCTAVLVGLISFHAVGTAPADTYGPDEPESGPWRRQVWRIPSPLPQAAMRAVIVRPQGPGPFPLMVMNHGSTQSAERRMAMALPDYGALARYFVRRGYAVALPQRPGHGSTGGRYLEDQNGCDDADFLTAGHGAADSIAAAITYLTAQPFVRRSGVIVVGQSAGAWGALALASRNPQGVKAVIAFAAGRGGRSYDRAGVNCVPDRLVAAARDYGLTARLPTLWVYTDNDSYFPPRLSRRLFEAFRSGGGKADYRLLPAYGADGHFLAEQDAAEPLWAPVLDEFLRRLR